MPRPYAARRSPRRGGPRRSPRVGRDLSRHPSRRARRGPGVRGARSHAGGAQRSAAGRGRGESGGVKRDVLSEERDSLATASPRSSGRRRAGGDPTGGACACGSRRAPPCSPLLTSRPAPSAPSLRHSAPPHRRFSRRPRRRGSRSSNARREGLGSVGFSSAGLRRARCRAAGRATGQAARLTCSVAAGDWHDPRKGEFWFAGEAAEAVLLELDARRAALSDSEADELDRRRGRNRGRRRSRRPSRRGRSTPGRRSSPRASGCPGTPALWNGSSSCARGSTTRFAGAAAVAARQAFEGERRGMTAARDLADTLRELAAQEASLRRGSRISERLAAVEGRLGVWAGSRSRPTRRRRA